MASAPTIDVNGEPVENPIIEDAIDVTKFPIIGPAEFVTPMYDISEPYTHYSIARTHMHHVPDAYIAGPHLICIDRRRRLVVDSLRGVKSVTRAPFLSFDGKTTLWDENAVSLRTLDQEVTVVGGKSISGFFHWIIEIVPRLVYLRETGEAAKRPMLMRPAPSRFQAQSLETLGISPLFVEEDMIKTPAAWFPSHSILRKGQGQITPDVVTYLNLYAEKYLGLAPPAKKRRLYISRRDAPKRRIANEEEVIAALKAIDFEIIEAAGITLAQQIEAFHDAEIVVGQHGAGLSLIAACAPGTKVIELYPEQFMAVSPFWRIANLAKLDYRMVLFPGMPTKHGHHNADLIVDPARLVAEVLA